MCSPQEELLALGMSDMEVTALRRACELQDWDVTNGFLQGVGYQEKPSLWPRTAAALGACACFFVVVFIALPAMDPCRGISCRHGMCNAGHVQCWAVHVQGRFHWRKLRGAPLATKETTDPWNLVTR